MATRFDFTPEAGGLLLGLVEARALRRDRRVGWTAWPGLLGRATMRPLLDLVDRGEADVRDGGLHLRDSTVAALPDTLARRLNLPSLAAVSLVLRFEGRIDSADGRLGLDWRDADQRRIHPTREGALLHVAGRPTRLTRALFALGEAADAFNATAGGSIDDRIAAWAPVQAILAEETGREITADGYARSLTFYQAGAFALDIVERADGPDFTPILMRRPDVAACDDGTVAEEIDDEAVATAGADSDTTPDIADPLLPEARQRTFAEQFSKTGAATRNAHVVDRNAYVVIPPDLKVALEIVREKRRASRDERRAFLRNPRAAIAEALEATGRTVAPLFVETAAYSARVEGLGLWTEITLPPTRRGGDWLPEVFGSLGSTAGVTVTADNVDEILAGIEAAERAGETEVEIGGVRAPIATLRPEVERVLAEREPADGAEPREEPEPPPPEGEEDGPEGLLTKENIDAVDFTIALTPRPPLVPTEFPHGLMRSGAKAHQVEGFDWLVAAWRAGWPGVLLADDMGLGKTYQALAFLAWVRANLAARGRHHPTAPSLGPMLVVAPTALLRNWIAEARRHLVDDGLGEPVEAFGSGLRRLKRPRDDDWTPEDSLDVARLREADWILTTYETLADNHRAFARVPCSLVVFDEIQKIKEPGSINTRSAKTLNADFVLGLTGTPIENRLEDLWSIFDRLAPGHLGALRDFSRRYGAEEPAALVELKVLVDRPRGSVPAPMLRRMKDRARDGLPQKFERRHPVVMPAVQADAYGAIVEQARGVVGSRRAMLSILHRMRGVSLHPHGADGVDTGDTVSIREWISGSARLTQAMKLLEDIAGRGEKALVFVEDLAIQRVFAEAVATWFDLDRIPSGINGGVAGDARQAIVDAFQTAPDGFDLLVLSPRAAGVGLTITAASHVIHLSRWWNPAVEDQCNDRAYRIGQTRDVTVHLPLALHPDFGEQSFDVKLDRLLAAKRALSREMLVPPESEADLGRLFGEIASAPPS